MWTWFLTRGTGAAALILLTGSVVLGVVHVDRWRSQRFPRFVVDDVHRMLSLNALALVGAHVVTSVLDKFAPVAWTDAFVPFAATYRPLWLGFGSIALDLMLLLVVTSALKGRIGVPAWRAVHWTAWACWPTAFLHTLGAGSDVKRGWMLVLALGCAGLIALALVVRLWRSQSPHRVAGRAAGVLALAGGALALAAWLPSGPLGHGWARRAGTPAALLVHPVAAAVTVPLTSASVSKSARAGSAPTPSLHAEASGVIHDGINASGVKLVDIALTVPAPSRQLDIRIAGVPLAGGGVRMTRSQVTFGPPDDPARYVGRLTSLSGTRLTARLRPLAGNAVNLNAALVIDRGSGKARGRIDVRPVG